MTSRLWKATILAGLFVGQTVPLRADDLVSPGRNGVSSPRPAGSPDGILQDAGSFAPQNVQTWGAGSSSPNFIQPPQSQGPRGMNGVPRVPNSQPAQLAAPAWNRVSRLPATGSMTPGGSSAATQPASRTSNARPAQPAAPNLNEVVRLPATGSVTPGGESGTAPAGQAVDGTWREDGHYVIITIDGKETKLLKPASEVKQNAAAAQPTEEGTVHGRLLQGEHPLAKCHVVIMPIREQGKKSYVYDETREPQTSITDSNGNYFFEHVPAGKYKLTWLPQGTKQWIRRLAIKPDVVVHGGQEASVKDIRFAQSTIN